MIRSSESIHNDMIQGIMNQIKMNEKLVETLSDTIQKSVNRFNWLENRFDQKQ